MDESILITIKKLLGIDESDLSFDTDILIHINTVFGILRQLGVGPANGFSISDASTTWEDYLGTDELYLADVKTYIYLKVRKIFDPPQSSSTSGAMDQLISELEWRINVDVDPRLESEV